MFAPACEKCGFQDNLETQVRTQRSRVDGLIICARCFDPNADYKKWCIWDFINNKWVNVKQPNNTKQ